MRKIHTPEMEMVVADFFDLRKNLIIPNIYYCMFPYEMDLAVITKSNKLYEVEIKVDKNDLKKDKYKKICHANKKVKYLYFAVPEYLESCVEEHVPDHAGILIVYEHFGLFSSLKCRVMRKPKIYNNYTLTADEKYKLLRQVHFRIWKYKKKLWEFVKDEKTENRRSIEKI